eukprot:4139979-Pyramimonas_sp.AAC.1
MCIRDRLQRTRERASSPRPGLRLAVIDFLSMRGRQPAGAGAPPASAGPTGQPEAAEGLESAGHLAGMAGASEGQLAAPA